MAEEIFYWQALNGALDEALAADESVFILGEDVGVFGGAYRVTETLYGKYGEWRVRDTPIAENSFVGLGAGAAMMGMRPVVELMTANFSLLAMDAILNMGAKIPFMSGGRMPMSLVIRMPGGVAKQLGAQHSQRLEHTLMNCPGLRIVVPATPQDAYWQLSQAIAGNQFVVILEHELLYGEKGPVDRGAPPPPMHRAAIRREGSGITLVSYSRTANLAARAADELAEAGISAEVIDLRSLKPIDWDSCAASVKKTGLLMVVEEDSRFAGAGAEIAASLGERCFNELRAPPVRLGGLDMPAPFNATLERATVPQAEDIVAAVRTLF